MRAQMGLCLMKFGPSCTCHFRGISDQRPLHRLKHPSRNWRESRSQESVKLIWQRAISSFLFSVWDLSLKDAHVAIARVATGRAVQRGEKIVRSNDVATSILQSRYFIRWSSIIADIVLYNVKNLDNFPLRKINNLQNMININVYL